MSFDFFQYIIFYHITPGYANSRGDKKKGINVQNLLLLKDLVAPIGAQVKTACKTFLKWETTTEQGVNGENGSRLWHVKSTVRFLPLQSNIKLHSKN